MLDLQALGQFADAHAVRFIKAFDRQQSLMLLRGDAGLLGRFFAEAQKSSQGIAECSQ